MNPSVAELISFEHRRSLRSRLLLPVMAILSAVPCVAQTCDYTVTSLNDSGPGTLRAGLADAKVTNICATLAGTITLSSPLQIVTPVTITGGASTIISGNNQVGIFVIGPSSATAAIRINGFTLTNGNATTGNNVVGGAVWVQQGNVTLVGTSITNNTATGGGGIYNSGTLLLSQCGVTNNTATTATGGGIFNSESGILTLQGTTVSNNSSGAQYGGGLDNSGTAQIQGGIFTKNQGYSGGAIDNESGGQMPISGGTLFSNNTASVDGGAIFNSGTTTITQALFDGNQATSTTEATAMGGAFYNNGTATISESTFYANTTNGDGGAIEDAYYYSILTLNDVTISGNSATVLGSGLDIESLSTTTINNTIIAGNTAIPGAVNSDCNACTSGNGTGNLIGVTVNLGQLALNGGPTQTMMPLPGSSAIAAGDPTAASGEDIDQRGFSRFNPNGTLDVGAVQSHYSSVAFATQPVNTVVNQTITPAVAVQVVETDGTTTNYPIGVPVTLSLINSQSNPVTGVLAGTLTQSPTNNAGVIEAVFPDLSVNATGSYQLFATDAISGNSSSANPAYSATSNSFQILVPVTLSWQPASLTYGPMPQGELNATATVNGQPGIGTFVYTFVTTGATINVGQIYPVGTYQVQVAFTPAGTTLTYTLQTAVQITQATPVLTWPTPAAIFTSTPLSSTQLDATAKGVTGAALPGTFVYSPASGTALTAGQQVLSTIFTPTDTADYTAATARVTIQVNAVTAGTVTIQESANPITFGQSETFTAVVTGTDGKPFSGGTASFTVDGAAIGSTQIVNGSGSVSDTALTAGTRQVGVSYASTPSSQALTASTTLSVNKATPALTWPTPAPIYTSTPLSVTQLDATVTGVNGAALAGSFAYSPAAGATLPAGSETLSTTFTPTDTTDYNTNTAQVTIQVNTPTAASIVLQESANPIIFGKSETLTAVITGSDGKPFSGGTASFTSDGTAIGSVTVVNGSASVSTSSLAAGVHQIAVSYTNNSLPAPLTGSAALTVTKATPVLVWATPAAIFTITPLSSTQLDATATGVNGAALAGAFVYNPAAGTTLSAGAQTLSTTFTPTDAADYTTATAQVTIQVGYSTISIASVSPGTAQLGTTPIPIAISGSGFTSTAVAEINGTAVATTVQSASAISATIPATDLASAGTLKISVYDPASKFSSNIVQFTVSAPAANITLSITPTTASGEQPTVTVGLNSPYPLDLQGTLTLTFSPSGNSVDDPAIQFSTGGRTLNFTIPAGTTTTPQVALQTGTVAGTITVTLTLTAGEVDVTPAGLAPITLVIAPSAPVITSVTFTSNSSGLITVVVSGFSNTRDMDQAEFVFTGTDASHLNSSKVEVPATGLFSPWYSSSDSDQYGSEFTYTQNFQLSKPDSGITGVAVTLANSVGASGSVKSQ